jgi:hypothetical protein
MRQEARPSAAVDRKAFAEAMENGQQGRRSSLRLGPALAAVAAAMVVVVGAAVIPQLTKNPLGTLPGGPQAAGASAVAGQQAAQGQGQQPVGVQATSAYPLTYASEVVVGPGAACCFSSGGTWAGSATGGYPAQSGEARISSDPAAWFEWDLGQPAVGHRWDQVKVRVWLPSGRAGAWIRLTVTSTAGGAANVAAFDVPEQEYEGWYELPATFTIGTPDQRVGSVWVRMTYLRTYTGPAADAACANGSCRQMAAAQVQFLWS